MVYSCDIYANTRSNLEEYSLIWEMLTIYLLGEYMATSYYA